MTATQPVALVTGASSGIGKAASLALAQAGFEVIGTSRHTSQVTPRDGVTFLDLDVTSDESVTTAVKQVIDRSGRIDVLVNNAGIGSAGAAEEFSIAQDQRVFDVNFFGLVRMTKAVLPHMRAQGRRAHHQHLVRRRVRPAALHGQSTSRPSTRSRATPSRWTTRSASTASGSCSSSPSTPVPGSTRTWCGATPRCRPTQRARQTFDDILAEGIKTGGDPAVVAKVIVAAATDPKPKLRYTAGSRARRVSTLRRIAPARVFDKQIRKINHMAS